MPFITAMSPDETPGHEMPHPQGHPDTTIDPDFGDVRGRLRDEDPTGGAGTLDQVTRGPLKPHLHDEGEVEVEVKKDGRSRYKSPR